MSIIRAITNELSRYHHNQDGISFTELARCCQQERKYSDGYWALQDFSKHIWTMLIMGATLDELRLLATLEINPYPDYTQEQIELLEYRQGVKND